MAARRWIRQAHRWVSVAFTAVSAAIFVALGLGHAPARWIYYLPLLPLALLVASGFCMFLQPFATRSARS